MLDTVLLITRQTKKKIVRHKNKCIILLLFFFFVFFCYLGTLPKHLDFWGIIAPGNPFLTGSTVYYNPLIGVFFELWIKIGSIFLSFDLNAWTLSTQPKLIQYWCIVPFLLMLLAFVTITYRTLKNKYLTFVCFGTFSFVSIIILGQVDIWSAFWVYIAIILALCSLETEDNLKYIFLCMLALGLSMQLKPFAGLLVPIFLVFFLILLQKKSYPQFIRYGILCLAIFEFFFISFVSWIIWPHYTSPPSGEAAWLFNLQLTPIGLPYHIISIWLLGYVVILYDLWVNCQSTTEKQLDKLLIFYLFAVSAWLFISVFTHPQWWLMLIPPLLLVLDHIEYKYNYFFYVAISELYLLYTLQWTNNIDLILKYYMPIITVEGLFSIGVVTFISAILLIWIFELRKSIFIEANEESIPNNNNIRKIALLVPAFFILILFLFNYILGRC